MGPLSATNTTFIESEVNIHSILALESSTFIENYLAISIRKTITIRDCTFKQNRALNSGAIMKTFPTVRVTF